MLSMTKKRGVFGGLVAAAAVVGAAFAAGFGERPAAEPVKIGEAAPAFSLTDTNGDRHSLSDFSGKVVVLEWFNPDCPFVKKFHADSKVMKETHAKFMNDEEVVFLAINSGAPGKQGAGLERNQLAIKEFKMEYPILLDESGEVGKTYGVKRTPEMFVIDREGIVRYHGPIDSKRSASEVGTNYLEIAVQQIRNGETDVIRPESDVYGCSVKYAN
ncbi:MAG: redoxin domain-containing protein [Planctomycetota bacterium]